MQLREVGDGATCRNVEAILCKIVMDYIQATPYINLVTPEQELWKAYNINVYSLHSFFHRLQGWQSDRRVGNFGYEELDLNILLEIIAVLHQKGGAL